MKTSCFVRSSFGSASLAACLLVANFTVRPLLAADATSAPAIPAVVSSSSADGTRTAATSSANYILHATDLLHVEVADDARAAHDVRVASDGTVTLAYLDDPVPLAGLTVNQAIKAIAKLYTDQHIFVKPQVSLVVLQYAEQHINIVGEVNHPGPVTIPPEQTMTLVSAVTAAGGHTRITDPDVTINRKLPDGKIQIIHANLKQAMKDAHYDIPLQDGDTVYLAEDLLSW
jgi:protein involved in polysaccharide export with SLBB domain